jgi:hypothetical protein
MHLKLKFCPFYSFEAFYESIFVQLSIFFLQEFKPVNASKIVEPHTLYCLEIILNCLISDYYFPMARQQEIYIQGRQFPNAFLQHRTLSSGEICPAYTLIKNDIP